MKNYEVQYEKIVRNIVPPQYAGPEEQGRQIKQCSLLRDVEIDYSHISRTGKKEYTSLGSYSI